MEFIGLFLISALRSSVPVAPGRRRRYLLRPVRHYAHGYGRLYPHGCLRRHLRLVFFQQPLDRPSVRRPALGTVCHAPRSFVRPIPHGPGHLRHRSEHVRHRLYHLADPGDLGQPGPNSASVEALPHITLPILGNVSFILPLAVVIGILGWAFMFRTPWGLRLRIVGEKPLAAGPWASPSASTASWASSSWACCAAWPAAIWPSTTSTALPMR